VNDATPDDSLTKLKSVLEQALVERTDDVHDAKTTLADITAMLRQLLVDVQHIRAVVRDIERVNRHH
jgi:hypothetical protein